ncbi:MAG TPA: nucleotidyl transferase AbiEii/AbiGii toxin family protein [Desulfatiglandales bacterium]|nr:nucleotidyl transferase AbiEii/AbiGii toxin family protein [Desulfatiglandales bacterium]
MTKKLPDLSGKIDKFTVELFEYIANVAEPMSAPFFVVGATARDIILKYGYGIDTIRATNDIDLGVEVSDWDQYIKLREGLVATGRFEHTREPQRLKYQGSVFIDVMPFGAIADPDGSFSWPPDHQVQMNTLGFNESYKHSLTVRLRRKPDLDIKFASQAGLALMKLISWDDRHPERITDAKDLGFLMRVHIDSGNEERLFEEEADLIEILRESGSYDYMRAGARLLGRDISAIANPATRERLLRILEKETAERDRYRLVEDMKDIYPPASSDFEENLALLEELKAGILEGPGIARQS